MEASRGMMKSEMYYLKKFHAYDELKEAVCNYIEYCQPQKCDWQLKVLFFRCLLEFFFLIFSNRRTFDGTSNKKNDSGTYYRKYVIMKHISQLADKKILWLKRYYDKKILR